MKIYVISLGCPRNLVDTEGMLGQLMEDGHRTIDSPEEADCTIINTCSFIQPATEESLEAILQMAQWKHEKPGRRLIVTGCLPQRYRQDLAKSLPEVDVFIGTGAFNQIADAVRGVMDDSPMVLPPPRPFMDDHGPLRRLQAGLPHLAYVKIAEGCSGHCTYCIIPTLRGHQRSRPRAHILAEVEALIENGVKEMVLVSQNTTAYGHDGSHGDTLATLLEEIAPVADSSWIRVLYGHPDDITDALIETIQSHDNICSYFDIPVQHISPSVLKRMGRSHDSGQIRGVFHRIRQRIPDAALRTTILVGFPGETEEDVEMLLEFMESVRFDHLGAFTYSDDRDLPSHRLQNHVPEDMKRKRMEQVMTLQASISLEKNQQYLGKTVSVLVDNEGGGEPYSTEGRTIFQAHDIDGLVHITGPAKQGDFVDVRITAVDEYDLTGNVV